MSTALEFRLRMAEADLKVQPHQKAFMARAVTHGGVWTQYTTHEVCGRRARKLKRAGWTVFRSGRTSTGKQRWVWCRVRAIKITSIYRGSPQVAPKQQA